MDDIPALVEDFFTASGTGEATKDKFRDLLPVSIGFLLSTGIKLGDIPNTEQMKQLDDYLQTVPNKMGKLYSASTIGDWKSITAKFYTFNAQKGDMLMTDTTYDSNITAGVDTEDITPDENTAITDTAYETNTDTKGAGTVTDPAQPDDEDTEKRKPGRPIKGDEGRDKKITVNIPTSIFNDIKDMANIDGVTFPDCLNSILEEAVTSRWKDIQDIRDLRARRTRRN